MHRRFVIWSRAGVWGRLHQAVLAELADRNLLDLSRTLLDTAHVRAKRGADAPDQSRLGRTRHIDDGDIQRFRSQRDPQGSP